MKTTALLLAMSAMASMAISQTTVAFIQSVGPNQTIPDPNGTGASGAASLFGIFGPAVTNPPNPTIPAFLRFTLNGVPGGYGSATPATQEQIIFALDFGVPPATGAPLLGGLIFLPVPAVAPVTFLVNTVTSPAV